MRHPRLLTTWIVCAAATTFAATRADAGPTFVIDFKTASAAETTAITGDKVGAFDAAAFGFTTDAARGALIDSVMTALRSAFYDIPTVGMDGRSPIADGKMLDVDFIAGTIGQAPSNGATEYYFVQVGSAVSGPNTGGGTLGVAGLNAVRRASGAVGGWGVGSVVASIFTDAIQNIGGLTPSNALKSGDLAYSTNAIVGTVAHEIGHTLSLEHEKAAGAITPSGVAPMLGTGAIDLPNQARISPREFSYTSYKSNGNEQHQIAQLVGALGLRDRDQPAVPEPAALAQAATALALAAGALLTRRRVAA